MKERKVTLAYRILKKIIQFFYPVFEIEGAEKLPEGPCVITGNHTQMNGPLCAEFYMPRDRFTWCQAEMMDRREIPGYAFKDFWSQKPRRTHWFWHIASYAIVPLALCLFNNAQTIPVYHDTRLVKTIRETVDCLTQGRDVVIFPEHDQRYNNVVYDFQSRFIDVARFYQKKTGRQLAFVPMYIAPTLKKIYFGEPVFFDGSASVDEERERVRLYLMDSITEIAASLPEHTVVPYRNYSKKLYPKNKPVVYYDAPAQD